METLTILQVLSIIINVTIVIIILTRAQRSIVNYYFIAFTLSSILWATGYILINHGIFIEFSNRLIFLSALLISFFLAVFTYNFPQRARGVSYKVFYLLTGPLILMSFFVLTGNIVNGAILTGGRYSPIFTKYYYIFALTLLLYLALSIYAIITSFRQAKGIQKVQLYFLSLGITVTIIFAFTTNLILPAIGIHGLNNLGPSFTIFFGISVLYTIVRHRFLNIKDVIGNIIYTITLTVFVNLAFFATLGLEFKFFRTIFTSEAYLLDVILSILFTIIFSYLSAKLRQLTRIYTGLEKQNRIISELHEITLDYQNLDSSLQKILQYLSNVIGVDNISLYTRTSDDYYINSTDKDFYNFLAPNYARIREVLLKRENLYITLEEESSKHTFPQDDFENFGIIFTLRIGLNNESEILYFIQHSKLNEKVFDTDEIRFLLEVFKQVSLLVNIGLFHQKIVRFNKTLQEQIEKATEELKQKNIELQKAYDESKEVARQERDMLDIMGHELRTPATVIKMAAYLLEGTSPVDENGARQVTRIKDSIERQIRLINAFINAAKIDNNRMELDLSPVHLDELVKQSVDDHASEAQEKSLYLSYQDNGTTPFVLADNARIREVIDNLITNAIKYTYKGSITVSCVKDENNVRVSVADTGEGIAPDDKKELFQKFKRLKNYTQTSDDKGAKIVRPGGTGLGLYVSKAIVEMHKGKIDVDSIYQKGSTFYFTLPIASEEDVKQYQGKTLYSSNLLGRFRRNPQAEETKSN